MPNSLPKADKTTLHIRNMVCPRCIMVVRDRLQALGLKVLQVELGYAEIARPEHVKLDQVIKTLEAVGFEYIREKEAVLVENAKIHLLAYIQQLEQGNPATISHYLSKAMGMNYASLSRLFSKTEGRTIQTYLVQQKIERVKELLDYDDLSLSQIALRLGYSSVHYLSFQFRKVTGLSVSAYKAQQLIKRRALDAV